MGLLVLSACEKPAERAVSVGLVGPVPSSSDWPFGQNSYVKFDLAERSKTNDLLRVEFTKAGSLSTYRETYTSGAFSQGDIWFKALLNTSKTGVAWRGKTFSLDGKTIENFTDQTTQYGIYTLVPNSEPLRIKMFDAFCPFTPYDETKPNAPSKPIHICQAKDAEMTWEMINRFSDMLTNPQMLELVNSQLVSP